MRKVNKITVIVYSLLGFLIGLGFLISALAGNDNVFYMGEKEVHGILSGILAVPFGIMVGAFCGLMHGVFLWFPIVYIVKKLSGRDQAKSR